MFKDVAGGLSTADLWHCFREPVLLRLPGDSALELNKKLYFTAVVFVVSRFKPC